MKYKNIIYEKKDRVAQITLNRPEKMNAISMQVVSELSTALVDVADDESIGALIITGAGEKAFTSGDDVGPKDREIWHNWTPSQMFTGLRSKHFYELLDAIRKLRKPVIAAVNGWCLASGLELALACDIVIASETAKFGLPFVNIGTVSGTSLLPRVIGYHQACELLFTGDLVDARRAETIGMVNRVVPPEQLLTSARELAIRITKQTTELIGWTKWALNRTMASSFPDALDYEVLAAAIVHSSRYIPSYVRREGMVYSKKEKRQ